jgi:hypothetical protein
MPGNAAGAHGRFVAPHAEEQNRAAAAADLFANEARSGANFHPVGAPPEGAVWRGIAAPEQIHPKGFLRQRVGADDPHGNIQRADVFLEAREHLAHEAVEDRRLDEGVVADEMNGPRALVGGNGEECFDHEMRKQRGVLAAGKADDPRARAILRQILRANVPANGLQFFREVVGVDHGRVF